MYNHQEIHSLNKLIINDSGRRGTAQVSASLLLCAVPKLRCGYVDVAEGYTAWRALKYKASTLVARDRGGLGPRLVICRRNSYYLYLLLNDDPLSLGMTAQGKAGKNDA